MIEHHGMTDADLHARILDAARGRHVVDLGAGLGAYHDSLVAAAAHVTMVDAFEPYLDNRRRRYGWRTTVVHSTIEDFLQAGPLSRWDLLLALDVVEHMVHDDGRDLLSAIPRLADRAIIFIPEGKHPQTTDVYGMGGDYWQTHRSVWYAEDLEKWHFSGYESQHGFAVERWTGFHAGNPCPNAIFATWGM